MASDIPDKSVLICGMGIAGPTLAYWLSHYGFLPTLIERAPRLRVGGYIIDFWGLGYDIAERMGLLPDLMRTGYEVQELRFVNDRGKRVGGFDVDVFRRITGGRYLSLPRGDLAALLYRAVESRCDIIFGDTVRTIEDRENGVNVEFERSPARRFGLVIGADGQHSAVRGLAFGPEGDFERYLGYAVAAFETQGYRPRDERAYVSYAVPGRQVARFAMRGDRTMFLFVFASDSAAPVDPHDTSAQKAVLHAQFDRAGWECPQILEALDRCDDLYFDRVSQIRMDAWSRGRVGLVGDAAFCPSLLAGQGAALAMTASYVLAGELSRTPEHFGRAFRSYELTLRTFIDGKQEAAAQFAGSFAPRTRFGLFLRNQVSRAFALPSIATLAFGNLVTDRLVLPSYSGPERA